jgi:hypothetical protein
MNDSKAAKKIKRLSPATYKYVNETTIRQRLPAARRQFDEVIARCLPAASVEPWLQLHL